MTSQFLEQERKKLKKEWEALEEPKLTWEQFKRKKQKKTFKQLIVNEKMPNKHEDDEELSFQDNVLTLLATLQHHSEKFKESSDQMSRIIKDFRASIHGEEVD